MKINDDDEYIDNNVISLKSSLYESLVLVYTNFTCNLHMQFTFTDFWRGSLTVKFLSYKKSL